MEKIICTRERLGASVKEPVGETGEFKACRNQSELPSAADIRTIATGARWCVVLCLPISAEYKDSASA